MDCFIIYLPLLITAAAIVAFAVWREIRDID